MEKDKEMGLDFIIDKLTNSIENVVTGDSFATEISILTVNDLKTAATKTVGFLTGKTSLKNLPETFTNLPL
jgi:hypothetical protein